MALAMMPGMKRTALILFFLAPLTAAAAPSAPLVDGDCSEYPSLAEQTHELPHQVRLYLAQDADNVWLCYSLPEDSFGTLDLELSAPGLATPLNLHISAQLGEWYVNDPDSAPQTSDSDRWWRVTGWWGNAVSFNGMQGEGDQVRPQFMPSTGRELQLDKARFGQGEWRLRFNIRAVMDASGERQGFTWPAAEEPPLVFHADGPVDDEAALRHFKTVLWPTAYRNQDVELLSQLLDESFQMIDNDGNRSTRQKELDWIASNAWNPGAFEYRIERLDIYQGRIAIIDGTGVAENYSYKSSNVLIKKDGAWRAVSSHVSGYTPKDK
jgi:hypothetical protein